MGTGDEKWAGDLRTSQSPRTFHMSTVLSAPHDATVAPSGENLMELTASPWPSSSMMGASSEDVRFIPFFGWGRCAPGTPAMETALLSSPPVLGFCATT